MVWRLITTGLRAAAACSPVEELDEANGLASGRPGPAAALRWAAGRAPGSPGPARRAAGAAGCARGATGQVGQRRGRRAARDRERRGIGSSGSSPVGSGMPSLSSAVLEVDRDEQVGVVAADAVEDGPRERVGRQQLERVGEVLPGGVELGEDRRAAPAGRRRCCPSICSMTRTATSPSRSRPWSAARRGPRAGASSTSTPAGMSSSAVAMVCRSVTSVVLSRSRLSSARTICSFCASRPPTKVSSCVERALDLGLAAVERADDLRVDHLELLEAAAVEHERERAEHLLDLRAAGGVLEADQRAGAQRLRARPRSGGGGSRLTNFSPSRLVWRRLARRVGRHLDVAVDADRHERGVAVELDVADAADGDVVDLDGRLRHEVEHVGELDLHLVGVVAVALAAGQRDARRRPRSRSR